MHRLRVYNEYKTSGRIKVVEHVWNGEVCSRGSYEKLYMPTEESRGLVVTRWDCNQKRQTFGGRRNSALDVLNLSCLRDKEAKVSNRKLNFHLWNTGTRLRPENEHHLYQEAACVHEMTQGECRAERKNPWAWQWQRGQRWGRTRVIVMSQREFHKHGIKVRSDEEWDMANGAGNSEDMVVFARAILLVCSRW